MRETSRQRRQRETRDALLAAALELFSAQGYAGTSLDQVATAAGFTKGAVYGLFSSKEDLFMALAAAQNEETVTELGAALPPSASPEVLLHSVGQYLAGRLRDKRGWALANAEFAVLAARKPSLAERRRDEVTVAVTRIKALLERVRPEPTGMDTRTMARLVVAVMNGLAMHGAIDPTIDIAADFSAFLSQVLFVDDREVRP